MKPLNDLILLKKLDATDKVGGIILPDSAKSNIPLFEVLEVSEEIENSPVTKGNQVFLLAPDGKFEYNSQDYYVVRKENIAIKL